MTTTPVDPADTLMFGVAYLQNYGTQNLAGTYTPKEIVIGLSGVGAVLLGRISEHNETTPLEALAVIRDLILPGDVFGPEQTDSLLYGIAVLDASFRDSDEDLEALFKDGSATITGLIGITLQLTALLAQHEGTDIDGVLNSIRGNVLDHVAGID